MIRTGEDSFEDEYHDHYENVFGKCKRWAFAPMSYEEEEHLATESKKWEVENAK